MRCFVMFITAKCFLFLLMLRWPKECLRFSLWAVWPGDVENNQRLWKGSFTLQQSIIGE